MSGSRRRVIPAAKTLLRADLAKKGLRNPGQIPPFLLGRLFPNSKWAPNWRQEDGYVVFGDGGFAGGDPSRPELSTRIYNEVQQLHELLSGEQYDRSLEIGCGYGRLTPWIATHAETSVGIDPNKEAIEQARTMYPDLEFTATGADDLPFPDDEFDLVVSWAVLQHVPPDSIEQVAAELDRVSTDDGTIVLCEKTSGDPGSMTWVRSPPEYEALFAPRELGALAARPAEPTFDYADYSETMVFTTNDLSEPDQVSEAEASNVQRTMSVD